VQQKISMLKQLALHGTEQEAALLNEHCSILEKCVADIYHPNKRTVFIFEYAEPYFEDCCIKRYLHLNGAFDTVDELVCEVESCLKNYEEQTYGYITLLQIPPSGKNRNPFNFTMFWIDGCWQVKDIMVEDGNLIGCGFTERAVKQLDQDIFMLEHFPLPFEDKSRLKLQTPFMEEPFYGILDSGCGHPGEWYHYLWDESVMASSENTMNLYTRKNRKSCISLSYMELNLVSGYSTLDWLERA